MGCLNYPKGIINADLIDAVANRKGYKNLGWFGGDDYLTVRIFEIINGAIAKNNALRQLP